MKGQEPEDEEARRKRIRLERELKRNKLYVKKTDLSFAIANKIITDSLIDQGVGGYLLEKKVTENLIPYLVYETIIKINSTILKWVGDYDIEKEAIPGDEPKPSSLDLWVNEKINVEKYVSKIPIKKHSTFGINSPYTKSYTRSIK